MRPRWLRKARSRFPVHWPGHRTGENERWRTHHSRRLRLATDRAPQCLQFQPGCRLGQFGIRQRAVSRDDHGDRRCQRQRPVSSGSTVFSDLAAVCLPRDCRQRLQSSVAFQLQPYSQNNVMLSSDANGHTMTFATPTALQALNVLAVAPSGAASYNLTINFTDGSHDSTTSPIKSSRSGPGAPAMPSAGPGVLLGSLITTYFRSIRMVRPLEICTNRTLISPRPLSAAWRILQRRFNRSFSPRSPAHLGHLRRQRQCPLDQPSLFQPRGGDRPTPPSTWRMNPPASQSLSIGGNDLTVFSGFQLLPGF